MGVIEAPDAALKRRRLVEHLEELIAALDRRAPQLAREGETQIARDADALRTHALDRLAELARPA